MIRSSDRHQAEKDQALGSEEERAAVGEAETNLNMSIGDQEFVSATTPSRPETNWPSCSASSPQTRFLRRRYESTDKRTGRLLSASVSYMPKALVEGNPELLDQDNEPWWGGTQHQLSTVGIEIMCIVDQVTARMPSTVEAQLWDMPDGIPLLFCRRISVDEDNRTVEISDAHYPADRTELRFVTPLQPWDNPPAAVDAAVAAMEEHTDERSQPGRQGVAAASH